MRIAGSETRTEDGNQRAWSRRLARHLKERSITSVSEYVAGRPPGGTA
jgi:hypothetical protein